MLSKRKFKNQTFNLTYGNSRSIKDLISILKTEFPKIEVEYKNKEEFMPEGNVRYFKSKKINQF